MKRIKMRNLDVYALVDDEDYERLSQYKWRMNKSGYAITSVWLKGQGKGTIYYMHRLVIDTPKGMDTDHIDQNKLNNQKANLRIVTRSENMSNVTKVKNSNSHSHYKGVSRLKRPNLKASWMAYIKVNYKTYYLGYFETEEEAAYMYNQFAEQIYGEFSALNDI